MKLNLKKNTHKTNYHNILNFNNEQCLNNKRFPRYCFNAIQKCNKRKTTQTLTKIFRPFVGTFWV